MSGKMRAGVGLAMAMVAGLWGSMAAAAQALEPGPPFALPVAGNFALATVIVAFLMSPVIDTLNRSRWRSEVKAVAAFGWCVVASVLLFAAGDRFDLEQRTPSVLFGTVLAVFVLAVSLHQFYWRPSGISDAIARATG